MNDLETPLEVVLVGLSAIVGFAVITWIMRRSGSSDD